MKNLFYYIGASLMLLFLPTQAQYKVATWYQQKTSAVTYTFDGYNNSGSNQLSVAVPLFDAYDYKVTITIITDWVTDYTDLIKTAKNGHEMASLTVTHNSLANQTDESQEHELSESQRLINENISGTNCISLALPYCELGNMELVKKYYFASRICSGVVEPSTPSNLYQVSSILTGSESSVTTSDDMNSKVDIAKSSGGWCVFLIHGIDGDMGYSPIGSRQIKKHLAYVNENDSAFWVTTFANAVKYIRERDAAQIQEQIITTDSLKVSISDGLDDILYNHPLTITRTLPTGWSSAAVFNGSKQVTSTVMDIEGIASVVFETLPDKDDIYIAKREAVLGVEAAIHQGEVLMFPNPFSDNLTVQQRGEFQYEVYSLNGKLVLTGQGFDAVVIGDALPLGVYVLKTISKGYVTSTKIVKLR